MADEDAEIVALIDNELDKDARMRLLTRLATDEPLRKRYEALREAKAPIVAALEALIEKAPLSRLRGALPPESASRATSRPVTRLAFRDIAAGVVGFLLGAGAAAWIALSVAPRGEDRKIGVGRSSNIRTSIRTKPSLLCTPTPHCRRSS